MTNAREEQQMSNENDEQNRAEVDLRTPDVWCVELGVQILDADGWRGRDGRPWSDPISQAEFQQRLATCTQRSIPLPAPNTRRLASCVKNWPDCESGQYNPACCRFPKSCSCTSYNPDTINEEDLEPVTTQPAGEHHTGTLDLTGEGNAPANPIPQAAVTALATLLAWSASWDTYSEATQQTLIACALPQALAALEAAYPAIRQQVTEEIAAALTVSRSRITEGRPGWVYFSEAIDIAKRIGESSILSNAARVDQEIRNDGGAL